MLPGGQMDSAAGAGGQGRAVRLAFPGDGGFAAGMEFGWQNGGVGPKPFLSRKALVGARAIPARWRAMGCNRDAASCCAQGQGKYVLSTPKYPAPSQ